MENRLQFIDFKTAEDFLAYQPKSVGHWLSHSLKAHIPEITEQLSYYACSIKCNKNIDYIQPASAPWKTVSDEGAVFGFVYGNLLQKHDGYSIMSDRQNVGHKKSTKVNISVPSGLKELIYQPVEIAEKQGQQRSTTRKGQ